MSASPVQREQRWLHSVPAAPWPDGDDAPVQPGRRPPALLDGTAVFALRSRARPSGVEPHDLPGHQREYGTRPVATWGRDEAVLAALEHAALTGRGGGHFPVVAKWRAALAAGGGGLVVANGAEGEPASVKDAALLQLRPHLVLDGLAIAAEVLGAQAAVVWLHAGDVETTRAVTHAVAERRAAGAAEVAVRIAHGPDRYLSGESSAVVRALSGGPALPLLSRRPAATSGVQGRPTVLHNAETLAMVALVARAGTTPLPQLGLVTLVAPTHRLVLPVGAGETFAGLLARGGLGGPAPQAVLVGGYGGSWVPWSAAHRVEVSQAGLRPLGVSLGAGVVAPLPVGACGIAETSRLLTYLAASGARQCGPCLFGLPSMADLVTRLRDGRSGRGDLRLLQRYAAEVDGRGACHHPDGAVRLVRSALRTFGADVQRHLSDGPCPGAGRPALLPVPSTEAL